MRISTVDIDGRIVGTWHPTWRNDVLRKVLKQIDHRLTCPLTQGHRNGDLGMEAIVDGFKTGISGVRFYCLECGAGLSASFVEPP